MHLTELGTALLLAVAAFPSPSSAEDVYIQAADTVSSGNISLMPIAIDGGWLTGMDYTGEWVEYRFGLTGFGVNESRIVAMGSDGVPFNIRMTLTGDVTHSIQTIDFSFTGSGFSG